MVLQECYVSRKELYLSNNRGYKVGRFSRTTVSWDTDDTDVHVNTIMKGILDLRFPS